MNERSLVQLEDEQRAAQNIESLTPMMIPVRMGVEAICIALIRYASQSLGESNVNAKWAAQRAEEKPVVTFTLKEGPMPFLRLQFSAEPAEDGSTIIWVTGEYGARRTRMNGALERWRARREAQALRGTVLTALPTLTDTLTSIQPATPAPVRGAERLSVRAPARLYVANRAWRAEVLNVSQTGIALVILASDASQAEADAKMLLQEAVGEIEVLLLGETSRARIEIKHAVPGRGGVQVGVHVLDPESTKPLLRKALARTRPIS